jgi:hypothetical protein
MNDTSVFQSKFKTKIVAYKYFNDLRFEMQSQWDKDSGKEEIKIIDPHMKKAYTCKEFIDLPVSGNFDARIIDVTDGLVEKLFEIADSSK